MMSKVNTDQRSLSRFIRLVATSQDTPILIQRIAEYYPNMVYCSAFVIGKNNRDPAISKLHNELKEEVRRQGFLYESVNEKIIAVAAVLGLGKNSTGEGQLKSIQMDYYGILGVAPEASALEIKKAYRARAFQTHPDTVSMKDPHHQAREDERFLSIQEAYNVLSDPGLKRHYDVSRNQKNHGQWSENETFSGRSAPVQKMPSAIRLYGYPLMAVILLLAGVTVIADMAIRENSLSEGLERKRPETGMLTAPVANSKIPESAVEKKGKKTITENNPAKIAPLAKSGLTTEEKMKDAENTPSENIPESTVIAVAALQQHAQTAIAKPVADNKAASRSVSAPPIAPSKMLSEVQPENPIVPSTDISIKNPSFAKGKKLKAIAPDAFRKKSEKDQTAAKTASNAKESASSVRAKSKSLVVEASPVAEVKREMAIVAPAKPIDYTGPLTVFLNRYQQAYMDRDIDRFLAFFSKDAVENNTPLIKLIPSYQDNFNNIPKIEYTIDMANYILDLSHDQILLKGRFAIKWLKNDDGQWRYSKGNIQMGLVAYGDSFLVQKLSYQFDEN